MFREQLMSALKEAVGHYNGGMSDDDAVVKSAEANSFNPDQTQRLLEVYNTTKTICFFKTAEDRTVEFTTADPEKVASTLFSQDRLSEERKTASDNTGFIPDYSEYDQPESDLWDKAAEDLEITPLRSADHFDKDMDGIARSAYMLIDSVKQSADHCASTAGLCSTKYQLVMNKLASVLQEDYFNPNKYAEALTYFKAAHSEQADPIINDLIACLPVSYKEKKASDELITNFNERHAAEANLFKQAVDLKLEYAEMKACEAQFNDMAKDYQTQFDKAAEMTNDTETDDFFAPGLQEKLAKSSYESISTWDQLAGKENPRKIKTEAMDPIGDAFGLVGGAAGEATKKELTKAIGSSLAAPAENRQNKLTDRMRNFQRQLILEDLITTDPVLQSVDPQLVANAYQTILQLSPEMSMNKEVVRSVLRASTNAEATSPFDAKVLAELENEIGKQTKPLVPPKV